MLVICSITCRFVHLLNCFMKLPGYDEEKQENRVNHEKLYALLQQVSIDEILNHLISIWKVLEGDLL